MRKHYTAKDFVITSKSDLGEYGYCNVCKADMQRFYSDNILRHYNSHQYYKRLNPSVSVSQLAKVPKITSYGQHTIIPKKDKAGEVLAKMGL